MRIGLILVALAIGFAVATFSVKGCIDIARETEVMCAQACAPDPGGLRFNMGCVCSKPGQAFYPPKGAH